MPASTRATARPESTVEALRQRFLERSAADLILLYAYPQGVSREELGFLVHRLVGAAAIFGYPELSAAAAELEAALEEQVFDPALPTRPLAKALARILAD
jgi:HPt (histidine-containing phosphotransfer) domain-containing protein